MHILLDLSKKKILSFGKLKLMIPKEAEKYLEHIYGRDWKNLKKIMFGIMIALL